MVQVGQRVQVKQSAECHEAWKGRTGSVIRKNYVDEDDYAVNFPDDGHQYCGDVQFYGHELIVLGGKHAGQPHPENFTDVPPNYNWALFEAGDRGHGKHAAQGDKEAEMAAYESEQHYL